MTTAAPHPHAKTPTTQHRVTRSWFSTTRVARLAALYDDRYNVAVLRRDPDPDLVAYMQALPIVEHCSTTVIRVTSPDFTTIARTLPAADARDRFFADLTTLSTLIADLTETDSVGIRFTVTQHTTCPRFHVDRVLLRLATSYQGAGSEWLDDNQIDRTKLGHGNGGKPDHESGLMRDHCSIHRLDPFSAGFFKGALWPGHENRAAVHRSPRMPALATNPTPRVLVTIDPMEPSTAH